jgi:hypothetical protein
VISEAGKHTYEDRFSDNLDITGRRFVQHVGFLHRYLHYRMHSISGADVASGSTKRVRGSPRTLWMSYAELATSPRYLWKKAIVSKGASSQFRLLCR